ncbi:MAG: hypothetical protein R6V34_03265 [Bacteroidales bacterium]
MRTIGRWNSIYRYWTIAAGLRVSYAASEDELVEACRRIKEAVEKLS